MRQFNHNTLSSNLLSSNFTILREKWHSLKYLQTFNMFEKTTVSLEKYMSMWNNILSALGLSSIKQYQTEDGGSGYKISFFRLIIPIVIVSLLSYLLYFQIIHTTFQLISIGDTVMTGYLSLTGNVVTALSLLSALVNSNPYARMKYGFLKFGKSLKFDVSFLLNSSFKMITIFAFVYFASLIIDIFMINIKQEELGMLKFVSIYIFEFYNFLGICHFSNCCFWLRQAFLSINKIVENHLNEMRLEEVSNSDSIAKGFFKKNAVFPSQLNQQWMKAPVKVLENNGIYKENKTTVDAVKRLRASYHDVYHISLEVNKVFSTRNLLTVGHNFLLGTIYIYCGFSELVKYTSDSPRIDTEELFTYFKWSAVSFLSIFGLVWPSTTTATEAQKTSALIQELLTKAKNLELRNELHSFALQFSHEKVSFSPHGFFTLNNQLLLSIVGAVASYLVVLIQFKITMN